MYTSIYIYIAFIYSQPTTTVFHYYHSHQISLAACVHAAFKLSGTVNAYGNSSDDLSRIKRGRLIPRIEATLGRFKWKRRKTAFGLYISANRIPIPETCESSAATLGVVNNIPNN